MGMYRTFGRTDITNDQVVDLLASGELALTAGQLMDLDEDREFTSDKKFRLVIQEIL